MTDPEQAFTRLGELIDAGHGSFPTGDFFLEVPTLEWESMEETLNRSAVTRKFLGRAFVWRGEYVTRGAKWMVHGVEK